MKLTLDNIKTFEINDYLGKKFTCGCGKEHSVGIERVIIGNGAINKLPELIKSFGYKKVYVVADSNTYRAAGYHAEQVLNEAAVRFKSHIYKRQHDLVPDEAAVGEFLLNMDKDTEVILAIGSGVLNDLCKYMSFVLDIPYIVVAAATSMDGYASDGAALIIENLKTTLPVTMPKAIVGDVDVLKNAPMQMIIAGFGDMVGKYSAINDWQISSIINGEYYCTVVAQMVMDSLDKCIATAEGLKARNDEAVKNLMEGLVLTGIAMSFSGNSRPASGSEHHLSHFIEMMYLFDGKEAPMHGIKVGVNTLVMNAIREKLAVLTPGFEQIAGKAKAFDAAKWTKDVERIYRQAAPGVIRLNEKERINSLEERLERVEKIIENWNLLVNTLKDVPANKEIEEILLKAGAPTTLKELGVNGTIITEGMIYCKEVRARYTVLQLAWDLGVLEEYAVEAGK